MAVGDEGARYPTLPGAVLCDLDDGRGLRSADDVFDDGSTSLPNDLTYFVAVARTAASLVPDVERFIISYSPRVDQALTPADVWLLVGDETATPLPRIAVCPVFRTYGDKFGVPRRGWPTDPLLAAAEIALWARNRGRGVRRRWPHIFAERGTSGWLPLGMPGLTAAPADVPVIDERPIDVGFRGSVKGQRPFAPKALSRRRMVKALACLPQGVVVDFSETASFGASYALDAKSYADSLLGTKICLAPRGGSLETFRTFEGALAGCVIVTEPLPRAWFYAGLPRCEVGSWSELPQVVEELLSNQALMRMMSEAGRDWAMDVVGPTAIGQWVAREVKRNARDHHG